MYSLYGEVRFPEGDFRPVNAVQLAHCSLSCERCAKLNEEVLEAAKKCDKICVRLLRILLSQLKLQWRSCTFVELHLRLCETGSDWFQFDGIFDPPFIIFGAT
jgi:hypothetical protein